MKEVLKEEMEDSVMSASGRAFQELGTVTERAHELKASFVCRTWRWRGSEEDEWRCVCEERARDRQERSHSWI